MPHFEHTTTVGQPIEHVAAVLTAPAAGPLYTPTIIRITLDASDDGRAADLTYEQLNTTATRRPACTEQGPDRSTRIEATFTGSGVDGTLVYRLAPRTGATELVQRVEYEFAEWATIDLLESATATHNDRQLAAHLTTVKDLVDARSRESLTTQNAVEEAVPTRPAR